MRYMTLIHDSAALCGPTLLGRHFALLSFIGR